jgi:predicted nucleotide-binding protein (sugar kinase/HSP70/actin superfamily)
MKVTFPHMGNAYIGIKAMMEELGTEVIVPPKHTLRTMSLAAKYSPEGVCLPFKLNLANMIEGLDAGADTIVNVNGQGTCRMGYYFNVQEQILKDMGYDFQMVLTGLSRWKFTQFLKLLKRLSNNASWPQIIAAFRFGLIKISALDDIEILSNKIRVMETSKGMATLIYREAVAAIEAAADVRSVKKAVNECGGKLTAVPVDSSVQPLSVLVVGEIYVVLDPFSNLDVEMELGKMGVFTTRSLYLSRWINRGLFPGILGIDQWREVHKAARPYLNRDIGGDGWETIGEKITSLGKYDGMVHLMPFTCMPESVAQNIMSSTREKLPVLTVYCDEQTSKAGMLTRLEAFVDMMKFKQMRSRGK